MMHDECVVLVCIQMEVAKNYKRLTPDVTVGGARLLNQNITPHLICMICEGIFIDPIKVSCGYAPPHSAIPFARGA